MSTFGSAPTFTNFRYYEGSSDNQAATDLLTMPEDGLVTGIAFYASSVSGYSPTTFYGEVWGSGGAEICATAGVSVGAGSLAVGGQSWVTTSVASTYIAAGTQIYIGWARASGGSMLFSTGSGTGYVASGSSPGNLGSLSGIGSIGAYIIYTPVAPPGALTTSPSGLSSTAATLNGQVDPQGLDTVYQFQWALSSSTMTNSSPSSPADIGNGTSAVDLSANLTGLVANTTYYYQIAASNAAGAVTGGILSFTTNGLCSCTLTSPASGTAANLVTGGVTFDWTYVNGGASGSQTGYQLAVTAPGGTVYYWTGSAWSTTSTWVTSTAASVAISAAEWTLGTGTFSWVVTLEDANGHGITPPAFSLVSEAPPNSPVLTSPANSSYADASTFTPAWTYSPSNAVGGQTGWQLRLKVSGASAYSYWNVGTSAFQSTPITNSGSIESYLLPSGAISNGHTYDWSVANQDAGGLGNFASDFTFTAQAAPVVTVTAPSGSIHQTDPTVAWSATFPSGAGQTKYQVRSFTAAQYGGGGFNPASSAAFDDSGLVGGAATSYQLATQLVPGVAYRSYVNLTETGSETNAFDAFGSYTAAIDLPPTPTITATATTDPTTGCPMIQLQVRCGLNLLSAVDASFETGIGSFVGTNATLTQSSTKSLDGAYSLEMDCSGTSPSAAGSGYYAVEPSTQYTMSAYLIAGATARSCKAQINWYTSADALISSSTGTAANDNTSTWTQYSVTATSPSNAAYATVEVIVTSAASSELHYVDEVGLFLGASAAWSAGGLLPSAGVAILRSDGLYVRFASTANPASVPLLTQLAVVNDYEAVSNVPYTYTATVQGNPGTGQVVSLPSSAAGAALSNTAWWTLDPTNPASAVSASPMAVNVQQTEQSAAHYPVGQPGGISYPTIVSSGFNGEDGSLTWQTFDAPTYASLSALITLGKTVFVSSPFGEGYYGRIGPMPGGMSTGMGNKARDATLLPSVATAPVRSIGMTFVAQPRPAV